MDRDRAFQILFREKTFASVWHWLDRLGVPLRDRRDIAQEVFLAAHQSFHTYDPMRSRPERWLNKITVHVAAHYRDRAQHRREELTPEDFVDVVDDQPGPDEQIRVEQDRLEVFDVLQSIDPELRSVLIAHDIDGIPMAEIAEQHGIPLSTAYKWRARAIAAFQTALEQRRREETERTGIAVVPLLGVGELFEQARRCMADVPAAPEWARQAVMEGVRGALKQLPRLGPSKGVEPASGWAHARAVAPRLGSAGPAAGASVSVAAAVVVGLLWSGSSAAPQPGPAPVALAGVARVVQPAPEPASVPASVPASEAASEPASVPASAPARGFGALAARVPAPAEDRDLALFEACRAALDRGAVPEVLRLLSQYEREVPRSRFGRERRLIRVRALVVAGVRGRARAEAERLVADWPAAAEQQEIRALLEQGT